MMLERASSTYAPTSSPTVIYMPPMGDKKVSRSVSVVAIVLLFALLFMLMGMVSDNGFYSKEKVTWNRGYIDENGLGVYTGWSGSTKVTGMYTHDAIPIKHGVKIELDFDSKLAYNVYVYNEHDGFLGILSNPYMTGVTLLPEDFTGEFAQAKYIRVYAYMRENESSNPNIERVNRGKDVTFWDWLVRKNDIKIYVNQSGIKNTFEEWFG